MIEKRKFNRYNVSNFQDFHASLDGESEMIRVVSIGKGGCGFLDYNLSEEEAAGAALKPSQKVRCTFYLFDGTITVAGTLKYIKPLQVADVFVRHYGIEFEESHQELVAPFIEKLSALAAKGKILPA
ncbi:MAG: hypothetical protein J0L93_05285 [Deltaproteobacteria bacterium]|nr:hypothetical protein [Deltaproteobacteria bacterium]